MLDTKFVCTLSVLFATLFALCNMEDKRKAKLVESYGFGQQGIVAKAATQITQKLPPNFNAMSASAQNKFINEHNNSFYQTPGFSATLVPPVTQTQIAGAIRRTAGPNMEASIYGSTGAAAGGSGLPLPNWHGEGTIPSEAVNAQFNTMTGGNTLMQPDGVVTTQITGSDLGTNLAMNGIDGVNAENKNMPVLAQNIVNETGMGGGGPVQNALRLSKEGFDPNVSYEETPARRQTAEQFEVELEKSSYPDDEEKPGSMPEYPSCPKVKCPSEYMADPPPIMCSNYSNGNYQNVINSMLTPDTINDIPIGDMQQIGPDGDLLRTVTFSNLVYANPNRNRTQGDLIRGDVIPSGPVLDGNTLFKPSQAFTPAANLQQGALSVMGGMGDQSQAVSVATAALSSKQSMSVAGSQISTPQALELQQQASTVGIQQGLMPNATAQQRTNAGMQLFGADQRARLGASVPGT